MFEREKHFPMGKDRRDLIEEKARATDALKKGGADNMKKAYTFLDAGVDKPGFDGYNYRNSWGALCETFDAKVLPDDSHSLREYIETTLAEKRGRAVGIEFGGVGSHVFSEFTDGFFKKSMGMTLVDHRQETWFQGVRDIDKKIHHTVIEGDVLDRDTMQTVNDWLAGEKADLIIERMLKGLESVPAEPYIIANIVQGWYHILNDGGLMLIQVPVALNPILDAWGRMLQEKCRDNLEVQYHLGDKDDTVFRSSAIRILKLPGAPGELPLLDPKTVFHTLRDPR